MSMPFVVISGMHQLPSSLSTGTIFMQFSCTWLYEDTVRVSVLKDITMSYLTAFLLVVCSIVSSMFYDLCLRKKKQFGMWTENTAVTFVSYYSDHSMIDDESLIFVHVYILTSQCVTCDLSFVLSSPWWCLHVSNACACDVHSFVSHCISSMSIHMHFNIYIHIYTHPTHIHTRTLLTPHTAWWPK